MKPESIIIRKATGSSAALLYPISKRTRTMVNLYFRHANQPGLDRKVTSIRRAAFEISIKIPRFTADAMNYTRPSHYY